MKYRTVAGVYGVLFLSISLVMFSDLEPRVKMWLLRALLTVVVETLFLSSVALFWKLNSGPLRRLFSRSKTGGWALTGLVAVVLFMSNLSLLFVNIFYTAEVPNLLKFSLTCLGLYVQCFMLVVSLMAVCRPALFLLDWRKRFFDYKSAKDRVQSAVFYSSLVVASVLTICGFFNARRPPAVEHVSIRLRNFPRSMDDFKILMVSDVHFGLTVDDDRMDQIMSVISTLDYDLLAAIGDFTDLPASHAGRLARPLKKVRPLYGKYFVTGNHEYYNSDVDEWLHLLTHDLGFRVLRNENVEVRKGNDSFLLAGVDDVEARMFRMKDHGMDLESALRGCHGNRSVILLAHQPRAAKKALDGYDVVELVLSGHTHGGQMFPVNLITWLTNPFYSGLYSYGRGQVYVSQGAVYWGIPLRTFSRAEVNVVHLFRGEN